MKIQNFLISSAVISAGAALTILVGGQIMRPEKTSAATESETAAEEHEKKQKISRAYFEAEILPVIEDFCYDCHGDGTSKGDLEMDKHGDDYEGMLRDYGMWKTVLQHVESSTMPPAKKKNQPTEDEREKLVEWIGRDVFRYNCEKPDPGRVTIRRLNRSEYNNTIRDLVGVKFKPADEFPADDSGYGFDNNGDVLTISPMLFEKYIRAAETIMDEVVRTAEPPKPLVAYPADKMEGGGGSEGMRVLSSSGEIWVNHEFPTNGEYRITMSLGESPAGDEHSKAGIILDGREQAQVDVPQSQDKPGDHSVDVKVEKGRHKIAVSFLNDFYDPNAADQNRRDRNLFVHNIRIEGPKGVVLPVSKFHQRFLSGDGLDANIREFATLAFRRPVRDDEVSKLMKLAESEVDSGKFGREKKLKLAFTAILSSPSFLFRGESQPQPDNPNGNHLIDEFALASRLSYFLWSSLPDEKLIEHARNGTLRQNLDSEVERMLNDWKARSLTENFAGQWLQLRNLDLVFPNEKVFKDFDGRLKYDMRQETEAFFEHIVKNDLSVLDFLSADYSFLTERLANYYGVKDVKGDKPQKVSLKGTPRGGLLTQGSILTLTSNPTRTSPVKRGKWVLDNILGTPPPDAPPNVPLLEEARRGQPREFTLRQSLEQHREDPNCAACHALMDPIGFAMENFDATGKWREKDGNDAIDSSGELVSGEKFAGMDDLRRILVEKKSDQFVRCLSERLLTYSLGRGMEFYDRCAVKEIEKQVKSGGYRFSSLVKAITHSVPFQYRRGEGERDYD